MPAQLYLVPACLQAVHQPAGPEAPTCEEGPTCVEEFQRLLGASFPRCHLNENDVLVFERLDDRERLARLFRCFGMRLPRRPDAEAYRIWCDLIYVYGPGVRHAAWRAGTRSSRAPQLAVRLDPEQSAYVQAVVQGAMGEVRQRARRLFAGHGRALYLVDDAPLRLVRGGGA